jgi:VWFA-related protein
MTTILPRDVTVRSLASAFLALSLIPTLAMSQTNAAVPSPTPANAPNFKTTTREVVLDVVVTKVNGDPVASLGKQDFAVEEDGKPQSIDFFEEHAPGIVATKALPEMPPMPADAVTNVPPAPVDDAVNVLLLDSLNTQPQDQPYVHKQILAFLSKMKPGTRVAIFTLGTKLHYVQGFTTDSSVLLRALNESGLGPERNGQTRSDRADDAAEVSALRTMQAGESGIQALQNAQAEARSAELGAHAAMTFEALSYLAHYLSGVPGRKNLLWFSSAFPVVIFPSPEESRSIEKSPSLRGSMERIKETADLFTHAQISIYPIGAQGMIMDQVMEADNAGPGSSKGGGRMRTAGNTPMQAFNQEAGGRAQTVAAMEQLAASTGGKAFYNTNDLNGAMDSAISDGAHYYTIAYAPTDKTMDGKFRRIDVKVNNAKYKLAYRRGYNAEETPAMDPHAGVNPLASLLDYGLPGATGVLYGVSALPGPTEEATASNVAGQNTALRGKVTRYRVSFTIRTGDVELQDNAQGGRNGQLLIGLKVYDHDGRVLNWLGGAESLQVKDGEYGTLIKDGIRASMTIDVPANVSGQHLVTAVYDWNSGRAGTLEVALEADSGK